MNAVCNGIYGDLCAEGGYTRVI